MHGFRPTTRSMTASHAITTDCTTQVRLAGSDTLLHPSRVSKGSPEDHHRPSRASTRTPRRAIKEVNPDDNDGNAVGLPPTPESLPRKPRGSGKRKRDVGNEFVKKGRRLGPPVLSLGGMVMPPTPGSEVGPVLAFSEEGRVEPVGKIRLLQDRVRHDPWRLLVACCLLNKTSGRAARPVFYQILDRWPTPQALYEASIPDLAEVLYPIGLFNQRASSLVRMSGEYISLGWPSVSPSLKPGEASEASDRSSHPANGKPSPRGTGANSLSPLPVTELDVNVFHGAGRYASDSFRIYSPLLRGKGGPEGEAKWVVKRERALGRMRAEKGGEGQQKVREVRQATEQYGKRDGGGRDNEEGPGADPGVEEVGDWLSEDDEDDSKAEWRQVRANDKELRRYLIWRWALEGIVYDVHEGPLLVRDRDKRRLVSLAALD